MKINWFKRWGWFHLPVSWQGVIIALATLLFCAQVFWAIDRRSHSVTDTLYGVFPFLVCSFLLFDWIANRASHETK